MSEVVEPDLGRSGPAGSRLILDEAAHGRSGHGAPMRRPSGAPPPLPRDLRTTGVSWLVAAVVAVVATVLIFRNGVSGAAINVIVVDDILTTGATVSECVLTLQAGGTATVGVLTVARVV